MREFARAEVRHCDDAANVALSIENDTLVSTFFAQNERVGETTHVLVQFSDTY